MRLAATHQGRCGLSQNQEGLTSELTTSLGGQKLPALGSRWHAVSPTFHGTVSM